jgi:hypothetical protein
MAPPQPTPEGQQKAVILRGTVTDAVGAVIVGATVTLTGPESSSPPRKTLTEGDGSYVFRGLGPGTYHLTINADGFAPWTGQEVELSAGEDHAMPDAVLRVAAAQTTVHAVGSQYELAEQQMHVQEKQRVLGVVPNFYTTYDWNAAPLTAGQKFRLAMRSTVDPFIFVGTGAIAGVEQWQNDFPGYGQGAQGYADRYGAVYGDTFIGILAGGALYPSLLHQDPRYFYKGTGSVWSRALYAISTVVITKGDNGRWQPNYSNILGDLTAAGIANLYYPSSDQHGFDVTIDNALVGAAAGALGALAQEFILRKISRGVPPVSNGHP